MLRRQVSQTGTACCRSRGGRTLPGELISINTRIVAIHAYFAHLEKVLVVYRENSCRSLSFENYEICCALCQKGRVVQIRKASRNLVGTKTKKLVLPRKSTAGNVLYAGDRHEGSGSDDHWSSTDTSIWQELHFHSILTRFRSSCHRSFLNVAMFVMSVRAKLKEGITRRRHVA